MEFVEHLLKRGLEDGVVWVIQDRFAHPADVRAVNGAECQAGTAEAPLEFQVIRCFVQSCEKALGDHVVTSSLILGGAAGAVAVRYIPKVVGMVPGGLADYGVKLATIVGGGYIADKFVSARAAEGFIIGSAAIIVTDLLSPVLGAVGLSGLDAFPAMSNPVLEGFGNMRYSDNLEAMA